MDKLKFIALLLLSALTATIVYILLHETGHMIVMLSAGSKITEFSILHAHVSGTPGNYIDFSDLWLHANGMLLPVITGCVYALLYNRNLKNRFYRFFSFFLLTISFSAVLAWVLVPILFMQGNAPGGDDVTNFLSNFAQDHSPLLVIAGAAVLFAAGLTLMIRKGVIRNYIEEIKAVKKSRTDVQ